MPELTLNYVVYTGFGMHTRQPRDTSAYGGFTPIDNLSGSPGNVEGPSFQVTLGMMPKEITDTTGSPPVTYTLAFVNVSGGKNGGQTSFDPNTPPGPATVGSAPIVALFVYLPPPGGNGNLGASIDAFDETIGSLVDDTFVTVSPDSDGSLTTSGNVEGWVSTANGNETIAAYSHIAISNADFERWVSVTGPPTPTAGLNFVADQNTNPVVLALYKATPAPPPGEVTCEGTVQAILKMASGIAGPKFTTAEWTEIKSNLENCVLRGYLTQATVNTVIAAYVAYAEGKNVPPKGAPPKK